MANDDIQIDVVVEADTDDGARDAIRDLSKIRSEAKQLDGTEINIDIPPPDKSQLVKLESDLDGLGEAGKEGGKSAADGIAAGFDGLDTGSITDTVAGGLTSALSAAGPVGAAVGSAVAGLTALFGEELADGFSSGFGSNSGKVLAAIRTGLPEAEIGRLGELAAEVYSDGFGDSIGGVREAAITLIDELNELPTALDDSAIIKYGVTHEKVFGTDIPTQVERVRRLVRNGLAPDVETAYDLMGAAQQQFGVNADEGLDALAEYAPVLGRMSIDGVAAVNMLGFAIENGIAENTDAAVDAVKELNTRITDGDAADALTELGLKAGEMQDMFAQGRAAEGMTIIAQALRRVESDADRAALANQVLGTMMEGIRSPEIAAEFLELAASNDVLAFSTRSAGEAIAESETGWGRAKREAAEFGVAAGEVVGHMFDLFDATRRYNLVFNTFADGLSDGLVALGWFAEQVSVVSEAVSGFGDSAERGGGAGREFDQVLEDAGLSALDAAGGVDEATTSVERLDIAIRDALGIFTGEKLLRGIESAADQASAAIEQAEGSVIGLNGEFNRSTDAGRATESALESVSGSLVRLADGYRRGQVTSAELAEGQRNAAAAVEEIGRQLGLTGDELEDLIERYGRVPSSVAVDLQVTGADEAHRAIDAFQRSLNATPTSVTARLSTVSRSVGSSAQVRATGGPVSGQVLVGERGPELVEVGAGVNVRPASNTANQVSEVGGGGGDTFGGAVTVNVAGSVIAERDLQDIVTDIIQRTATLTSYER